MITIVKTTPAIGVAIPVNVYYRSGFVEIINDSPFQLQAQLPTGTTTLVAGYVYAFPIGDAGMIFTLTPSGYLQQQQTINSVTVNAYQDGDGFNPSAYPLAISRQTPLPATSFTNVVNVGLGGSSITMNLPAPSVGQHTYLSGFILTADRSPIVQSGNVSILNVVGGNNIFFNWTQTIESGLYLNQQFTPALIDNNTNYNPIIQIQINVNNLNLSLSQASANLFVYGYIQ